MATTLSLTDDNSVRAAKIEAHRRRIDPGDVFDRAMDLLKARIANDLDPVAALLMDILHNPPRDRWELEGMIRSMTRRQKEEAGAALADLFGEACLQVAALEVQRPLD